MRPNMTDQEKTVLAELCRRAREIGQVRRPGLTLEIVATIAGIEKQRLQEAMDPTRALAARSLANLVLAWRITWAELLGDALQRCPLKEIGSARYQDGEAWGADARRVCCAAVESRRIAPGPGRTRLYYADLLDWQGQAIQTAAVLAVAPVVAEVLDQPWKAPRC